MEQENTAIHLEDANQAYSVDLTDRQALVVFLALKIFLDSKGMLEREHGLDGKTAFLCLTKGCAAYWKGESKHTICFLHPEHGEACRLPAIDAELLYEAISNFTCRWLKKNKSKAEIDDRLELVLEPIRQFGKVTILEMFNLTQ
jgi:hypothetical protein